MFNTELAKKRYYYDNNNDTSRFVKNRYSDLALGFGLGSKWVHNRGFVFEINTGIGRNLLSTVLK
jgi:hypothetical protein